MKFYPVGVQPYPSSFLDSQATIRYLRSLAVEHSVDLMNAARRELNVLVGERMSNLLQQAARSPQPKTMTLHVSLPPAQGTEPPPHSLTDSSPDSLIDMLWADLEASLACSEYSKTYYYVGQIWEYGNKNSEDPEDVLQSLITYEHPVVRYRAYGYLFQSGYLDILERHWDGFEKNHTQQDLSDALHIRDDHLIRDTVRLLVPFARIGIEEARCLLVSYGKHENVIVKTNALVGLKQLQPLQAGEPNQKIVRPKGVKKSVLDKGPGIFDVIARELGRKSDYQWHYLLSLFDGSVSEKKRRLALVELLSKMDSIVIKALIVIGRRQRVVLGFLRDLVNLGVPKLLKELRRLEGVPLILEADRSEEGLYLLGIAVTAGHRGAREGLETLSAVSLDAVFTMASLNRKRCPWVDQALRDLRFRREVNVKYLDESQIEMTLLALTRAKNRYVAGLEKILSRRS